MAPSHTGTPIKSGRVTPDLSGQGSPVAPGLCSATPLLEEWLFKQSSTVETVVTKRWGVLYLNYLVLFRKANDSKPSKVVPLTRCTLSQDVTSATFKIRKHSRSTVWALASGDVDEQSLHHFTITPTKGSPLTICFSDAPKAQQWHRLTKEAATNARLEAPTQSKKARRWSKLGVEGGSHSRKASLVDDSMGMGSDDGTMPSPSSNPASRRQLDASLRAESMSDADGPTGLFSREESTACLADDPNCPLDSFTKRWRSMQHVNGVAVYVEVAPDAQAHEGESRMMSVPVACTPEACFRAIMRHGFDNWTTLAAIDPHNSVLYQRRPAGLVTAARDCVLLRTWRRDVDGSYIILLQDTEHAAAPAPGGGFLGGTVRAHVQAAGFIIAPCAPEYVQRGRSTECLVTAMAKVDLGGWLSPGCWLGRWLAGSSLDAHTTSAWLQPLVSKVITLRDLVEQDRFLRKPFEYAIPRTLPSPRGPLTLPPTASLRFDEAHLTPSAVTRSHTFGPVRLQSSVRSGQLSNGLPVEDQSDQAQWAAGTLAPHFWAPLSAAGFKVRGPKYLADRKKTPAAEPVFTLASVDIVKMRKPCFHIARHLPSIRLSSAPFTFIVNIMVPSTPFLSLVVAWAADDLYGDGDRLDKASPTGPAGLCQSSSSGACCIGCSVRVWHRPHTAMQSSWGEGEYDSDRDAGSNPAATPFDLGVARFLAGTDEQRNSKFKLIPRIAEGSWVIKQSVGTTPVILGRKLTASYHRGPNYMEVDIDIGSSTVAASVVNLVYGATKSLVIDMAVLFEGQAEDELPEQLLGTVRLDHMDLGTAPWLDLERGVVQDKEPA